MLVLLCADWRLEHHLALMSFLVPAIIYLFKYFHDLIYIGMTTTKEINSKERFLEEYLQGIMKWNFQKVASNSITI